MTEDAALSDADVQSVRAFLQEYQRSLCASFEAAEAGPQIFRQDSWEREEGGGGITRVLEDGATFEKGGVNFSHVAGARLPDSATAARPELAGRAFQAMGVSVVMHPRNPMAPTSHANFRFFLATCPDRPPVWWFGGGYDLTPYYGFEEDCRHWHRTAATACAAYGADVYRSYKRWCDRYFHLPHRGEQRGIGGLFFDDLNEGGFERCFSLLRDVAASYPQAYLPIVERRAQWPWTEAERAFQEYRRGRYVEFNLVYDRGTLFGLQTGGRTESILMSLPPVVRWQYDRRAEPGSREAQLTDFFLRPRDWLAEDLAPEPGQEA